MGKLQTKQVEELLKRERNHQTTVLFSQGIHNLHHGGALDFYIIVSASEKGEKLVVFSLISFPKGGGVTGELIASSSSVCHSEMQDFLCFAKNLEGNSSSNLVL